MASRRQLKKDIDYLASEIISNCYTCLYFHPDKSRDKIFGIVQKAVDYRNDLFSRIKPAEKNNASLVRKHFAAIRNDMFVGVDNLFQELSDACK